ncbi:DNA-binding response regulator [Candidatus Roizmanbacteria bacterium RIFCSPHIGHO2_02_FULL_37_15]|uniref:DNA-binding response regulator n=1 Tax=Candidatus Roizmanbacteria bacterium RIFCSPLOWO2_01_FULL_37_16 TaxID=1802058 RepID=A0A1F7IQS9_9BACT|nr:MAG: DNA-binding response regulator [Candidatus Roizmanbacteria bacterium RIFCSPHIGHO2_01_FULL_37_16b]OGK22402.1 MAG: DNA-binding response regulator [Candidatus Roizmanbacteria bacterium RIFCSPHIGHO2_02_FULL_37_15]OGK32132.1 MAG: DNA-binding response regulator [Candidatus Roizmanbacteria bacterium RIFCSPHIGHO2_12_FULL_36_11]OGK45672.1 MAG: DNA-binding response regulator [Candidatus Roizmanbacteria bacterium RIFCSPLOWO2_01_FULL_37_16]OGK57856.1 MAG: DNA-binding response regulator [Candidatus 
MRILIVEDEHRLSNVVKKGLVEEGFAVDQAFDGEEGLYLAESESYDLIILDLMLPKIDGLKVCRELRSKKIKTPILMLTAKTRLEDKVKGLEVGADDYLAKPFAFAELKARIQALLRRSHNEAEPVLKIDDLEVDPLKHTVKRAGASITLTPKEFAILEFLVRHKDEVVTRTQITEHVWDYNFDALSNVVDVFIATLRKKINDSFKKKLINTIHGVGYKV